MNYQAIIKITKRIECAISGLRSAVCILAAVSVCSLPLGSSAIGSEKRALEHSVVKIYVTMQNEDYSMPWQSQPPQSGNGTGFIIKGNRILSNAHVVSNARFIEVKKNGSPRRYSAHVKFAAHDCDLAVLEVDDPEFFDSTTPVKFAKELPKLSDTVAVIGYPMGGSRISLTEGVISRIDYSGYTHSGVDQHLVLQVDAAINPGNSGGPVLLKGRVVGVAFQGMLQASNIGYVIPVPIINHFLKDIEDGKYNGYPDLGASIMDTRNAALKASLGLNDRTTGAVVYYLDPFGSAKDVLELKDVLLAIDGHNIAEDGTIELDGNMIGFSELIERKQWGDEVNLQIMRNLAVTNVTVPLTPPEDPFVFRNIYDKQPEYCILGGLVFSPLSRNYLATIGRGLDGVNQQQLLYASQYAKIDDLWQDRSQFVVLIKRLPHPVNSYAAPFMQGLVSEVNGIHIGSLADLERAIKTPQGGYHIIKFEGMDDYIVMDAEQVKRSEKEILTRYAVPAAFFTGEQQ